MLLNGIKMDVLLFRVNFVVTFCRKTSLQRIRENLNQNPSYDKMVGKKIESLA